MKTRKLSPALSIYSINIQSMLLRALLSMAFVAINLDAAQGGQGKQVTKRVSMVVTETIRFPLNELNFDEFGRPYIPFTSSANAIATHLGKSTFSSTGRYYLGPNGPTHVQSLGDIHAANGDKISFIYSEDLQSSDENNGILLLASGTGRFDQTEGSLQWDSKPDSEFINTVDDSGNPILLIINQGTMSGSLRY